MGLWDILREHIFEPVRLKWAQGAYARLKNETPTMRDRWKSFGDTVTPVFVRYLEHLGEQYEAAQAAGCSGEDEQHIVATEVRKQYGRLVRETLNNPVDEQGKFSPGVGTPHFYLPDTFLHSTLRLQRVWNEEVIFDEFAPMATYLKHVDLDPVSVVAPVVETLKHEILDRAYDEALRESSYVPVAWEPDVLEWYDEEHDEIEPWAREAIWHFKKTKTVSEALDPDFRGPRQRSSRVDTLALEPEFFLRNLIASGSPLRELDAFLTEDDRAAFAARCREKPKYQQWKDQIGTFVEEKAKLEATRTYRHERTAREKIPFVISALPRAHDTAKSRRELDVYRRVLGEDEYTTRTLRAIFTYAHDFKYTLSLCFPATPHHPEFQRLLTFAARKGLNKGEHELASKIGFELDVEIENGNYTFIPYTIENDGPGTSKYVEKEQLTRQGVPSLVAAKETMKALRIGNGRLIGCNVYQDGERVARIDSDGTICDPRSVYDFLVGICDSYVFPYDEEEVHNVADSLEALFLEKREDGDPLDLCREMCAVAYERLGMGAFYPFGEQLCAGHWPDLWHPLTQKHGGPELPNYLY